MKAEARLVRVNFIVAEIGLVWVCWVVSGCVCQ